MKVGDAIVILFMNKLNRSVNMYPHGVNFGFTGAYDEVEPNLGVPKFYLWTALDPSGPSPSDPGNSRAWA